MCFCKSLMFGFRVNIICYLDHADLLPPVSTTRDVFQSLQVMPLDFAASYVNSTTVQAVPQSLIVWY